MGLREPELQEGAKGQQKQKIIHTNTQRERERKDGGDSRKSRRQLPDEKRQQRPKHEEHDKTVGGIDQN
jgi:hypothetical protein